MRNLDVLLYTNNVIKADKATVNANILKFKYATSIVAKRLLMLALAIFLRREQLI